ncbi:hypothetical protein [Lentibacillus salicampi]|uniref:Uncharacterized protein n=1 Tax=Lentibacillus salicampi TaxID=175306 RepID=A0A4Y9AE11_9BACI|nr:hypothetical protein [Lentibacillus salicampi]TFJ93655.1 hypothetical protein E4U82_06775 [Lentibacillus salicampi]
MLEQEFTNLVNDFGVPVTLNDETTTRKAILSSQTLSDTLPDFDDKTIHSDFPIKRGDVITYNDTKYLIISDVQAKRSYEYKATIRPMTNAFQFTYMTDGYYEETDRFGNPIWIREPEEVTEDLPCIAQQEGSPTIESGQIRLPEERIIVIMSDDNISQQIEINSNHQMMNDTYNIVNINLLQSGLRIFTME